MFTADYSSDEQEEKKMKTLVLSVLGLGWLCRHFSNAFCASTIICPYCLSNNVRKAREAPCQISGLEGGYVCQDCEGEFGI